jgi:hypothetical protein
VPSLAEYQQAMHAYLLAEQEAPQPVARWCEGATTITAVRLAVYRGTVHSTLLNALRLSYPAVRLVLGADCFDALAGDFIRRAPPVSAYLNDYGEKFGAFVAEVPTTATLSYLQDLARLEWAVNRALHAPEVATMDPARLLALEPDATAHLCFRGRPDISVLALRCPAERIWQAVLERDEIAMRSIDLSCAAVGWVMVERDAERALQIRRMSDAVGSMSERLFSGAPLHAALGVADERAQEPALLQAALADHLACGRLVDFFVNSPSEQDPGL